jgi:hypothetical protein
VQGLFTVSLPQAVTGGQPAMIDTHTASIQVTTDQKTVVYSRTNGTLYRYDLSGKQKTQVTTDAITYVLAGSAIAYLSSDGSLHVDDGKAATLSTPAHTADLLTPLNFSPDGQTLAFFQSVDVQDNQGTLYLVAAQAGASPVKVAEKTSLADVAFLGNRLALLHDVDAIGQFGDAATVAMDGTGLATPSTQVPTGALKPGATAIAYLATAASDKSMPIDQSKPIVGALQVAPFSGASAAAVDPAVHLGAYRFGDDGRALVYIGGAKAVPGSSYEGSVSIYDSAAQMSVATLVSGAAELGPVVGRSAFVSAPSGSPAGIYLLKY